MPKATWTQQRFGNGVLTEQQYEAATNYLQRIRSSYNGATVQEFSYQFNELAHLMERQDVKRGLRESFEYDDVNRLKLTALNGAVRDTVRYDDLGNITYKSGVGSYEYGGVNNGPHRLLNVRTNNANLSCSFTLDITTEFTSFNKVCRIANDTSYAEIFYGPDQQRVMQKLFERRSGSQTYTLTRTKIYVGGLVEIESFAVSGRTKITSFVGGAGLVVRETQGASTTVTTKYYLKDHLGFISGFTGDNGVLLEEMSFDAWGQRRNADWTALASLYKGSHDRGFTNHEHYDLFSLIDMNGRVYDPVLGRFLSPDPFIQDMTDLQSLNRYSYCNNNPLSYTDPSGYFFKKMKKFLKKHWKTIAVVAIAVVTGGAVSAYLGSLLTAGGAAAYTGAQIAILSGAAAGFASNAVGTLLNGGSLGKAITSGLKGAVFGGISAGLTFGVGELAQIPLNNFKNGLISAPQAIAQHLGIEIVGNGVVQGAMSTLRGGSFLNGFISGAVSGGMPGSAGVVTHAIVGGTVSELTGGNFANGAISAAFVQMYNHDGVGHDNSPQTFAPNNGHAESSYLDIPVIAGVAFFTGAAGVVEGLAVVSVRGLSWAARFVVGAEGVETAAVINKVNRYNASRLSHIFSKEGGHIQPTNVSSQSRHINLFENVANNPANLNPNVMSPFQPANGPTIASEGIRFPTVGLAAIEICISNT